MGATVARSALRRLLLALSLLPAHSACAHPPERPIKRFEFVELHMATPFSLKFYAEDDALAERAKSAAFAEIASIEAMMSDYKEDSELSRLGRSAGKGPQPVSEPLFTVLEAARRHSELSGGAFDVTVGPVVRLWRRARNEKKLPQGDELRSALSLVGYRMMTLDPIRQTVSLEKVGMALDFGGIAKGYACDRALAVLGRFGIHRAYVDAGGGMALGEPPPGKPGWRIQVADTPRVLVLSRCGVATSGDWESFVEIDGTRYSHVVDPATGLGLTRRELVTVVAQDGITADALTKGVMIRGSERGLKLAEDLPGVEAWMRWEESGRVRTAQTSAFGNLLASDD
jgi:thiamine biosynthesis lipoprotein